MKQCPKCNSAFPDDDRFCEIDGTPLIVHAAHNKKILPLIAVVGVCLGVLAVLAYLSFSSETSQSEPPAVSSAAQPQVATMLTPTPALDPIAVPSLEPSPSPSPTVEASPSPSPQPSASPVELSSSPITTTAGGPAVSGRMIIRLISGGKIEAEEVWQTGEGIWYRKGTVVSLVDPKNVKSIDKVTVGPTPSVTKAP